VPMVLMCMVLLAAVDARPSLQIPGLTKQLKRLERFQRGATEFRKESKVGDMSLDCALCGIAVNEVLGLMLENQTAENITTLLKADLCGWFSGGVKDQCDELADSVPTLINYIEKKYTVSGVCTEVKFCSVAFPAHTDPYPVRKFTINLDLAPENRFTEV